MTNTIITLIGAILLGTELAMVSSRVRETRAAVRRIEKTNAEHVKLIAKLVGYTVPGQRK